MIDIDFKLIFIAFILDLFIGDPRWLPHPVSAISVIAKKSEYWLRRFFKNEFISGLLTFVFTLAIVLGSAYLLLKISLQYSRSLYELFSIYILFSGFALRSLLDHGYLIYNHLKEGDIKKSRNAVSLIVGRDSAELDEEGVVRASVESLSENLVDGVTAPLLFAFLAGPIGVIAYKVVNTLDSLFGYKNEKYLCFGRVSARLDDILNFIPARLTAFLVPIVSQLIGLNGVQSFRVLLRDRLNHPSPNSGHTESAFAGALNVQLGGVNYYNNVEERRPTLGNKNRKLEEYHIMQAILLIFSTSIVFFSVAAFIFIKV